LHEDPREDETTQFLNLTEDQVAIRSTALEVWMQFIRALESLLLEVCERTNAEWEKWRDGLFVDIQDGGRRRWGMRRNQTMCGARKPNDRLAESKRISGPSINLIVAFP
jgi:hypothetical protein